MTPPKRSNNIAARMGRWSASHWKTAVFGWLAFVVASLAIGMQVGTKQIDTQNANVGEAHRADQILRNAGFEPAPQTEFIVIQSSKLRTTDPEFRSTIRDAKQAIARLGGVLNLRSPLDAGHGDLASKDGRTALVEWEMPGKLADAEKKIDDYTAATARAGRGPSGLLRRRGRRGQLDKASTRRSPSSSRRRACGRSR